MLMKDISFEGIPAQSSLPNTSVQFKSRLWLGLSKTLTYCFFVCLLFLDLFRGGLSGALWIIVLLLDPRALRLKALDRWALLEFFLHFFRRGQCFCFIKFCQFVWVLKSQNSIHNILLLCPWILVDVDGVSEIFWPISCCQADSI